MNYEILMAVLVLLILIVEVAKLIMLKRGKLRFNLDMLLNFSPKILCGCKGKKEKKKFTPPPTVKPTTEGMAKFIGTKRVNAMPMTKGEAAEKHGVKMSESCYYIAKSEGYLVEYDDGYKSWSPQGVFETAYRRINALTFGEAIEAAKMGKKIARKGWNGKGMYLALQTGSSFDAELARGGAAKAIADEGVKEITLLPHLDMKTATGEVCVGWLASQTDMLADDWMIVE